MIELRSVSKRFDDGTLAVDDFSLTIPARQTTVLLGSSGSGKTTILRMINRMVEPSSGFVTIDGVDVRTLDPVKLRRSIGYVLQDGGLLPHRRVVDNVATVPLLNGESRTVARRVALELLDRVGLDPSLANRYPRQLSGGQRQRVGVARALSADPNILLMDEPFGAVDPIVRTELQNELMRLQRDLGKTIVFVTHDVAEAFTIAEQIIVLRKGGRIAQIGKPADIAATPADDFVASFIGVDRRDRELRPLQTELDGRTPLVDDDGRPAGFLRLQPGSQNLTRSTLESAEP
jgi:osmoprotectant transport system ATP-binding protein